MRRGLVLLAALALVALQACGDDDDDAVEPAATATVTVTGEPTGPATGSQTSPTTQAVAPPQQWSTAEVSAPYTGAVPPVPRLLAIRIGAHPEGGFDRAALEFDSLPGYRVSYQAEITYDGSGQRVDLAGDAFIQLVFEPAQAHDDEGNSTLLSPPVKPVMVDYPALEAYVLNGDFEGVVSFGLGVNGGGGFLVRQLERANGNNVIYIDLARP